VLGRYAARRNSVLRWDPTSSCGKGSPEAGDDASWFIRGVAREKGTAPTL
jgi:hypothetical protein